MWAALPIRVSIDLKISQRFLNVEVDVEPEKVAVLDLVRDVVDHLHVELALVATIFKTLCLAGFRGRFLFALSQKERIGPGKNSRTRRF